MTTLRVLSVAVTSSRAGYVYLAGAELRDWNLSIKAAESTESLAEWVQKLINELEPNVLVSEKVSKRSSKGDKSRQLIEAVARVGAQNYLLDVTVERPHTFSCKYVEAAELAKRHRVLAHRLPEKPPFYKSEPRRMILFEALALAEEVTLGPPDRLAAAMG